MMAKGILFLVEGAPEGGYSARALGHSIFTEADSWEELRDAVRDAVWCHFADDELPVITARVANAHERSTYEEGN